MSVRIEGDVLVRCNLPAFTIATNHMQRQVRLATVIRGSCGEEKHTAGELKDSSLDCPWTMANFGEDATAYVTESRA